MIILTAEQASLVRGPSAGNPRMELEPLPLLDGTFILPEDVLTDPAHEAHHAFLSGLPTRDVSPPEWGGSE